MKKPKTSKTIKTLIREAQTHIQKNGVQKVQTENSTVFRVSDGGWLLNWFTKTFNDGQTVLDDVMYGIENYDDWREFKGKIEKTRWGLLLIVPHCTKRSEGIKKILALIEVALTSLEPYFPKDEPYLTKS